MERAEELRRVIAAVSIRTTCGLIQVTMSMGVLAIPHWDLTSSDKILHEVDAALYAAKNAGRNCCRMAGEYRAV
jgi:GGDEF domain-containing protein